MALGVHPETIRRWIRRGWIPVVKVNSRTLRLRQDDLEKLIASKAQ